MSYDYTVIIRTKNEEEWLFVTLSTLIKQNCRPSNVLIIDNESEDSTLNIASYFQDKLPISILSISDYKPGKALNLGIENSDSDYLICLSAHCIPKNSDWAEQMIRPLDDNEIMAVYGRQLPTHITMPDDYRDLVYTFGEEPRKQSKDPFIHNANSCYRLRDLKENMFDNETDHIEDIIWGVDLTSRGGKIFYNPLAEVYHPHGLHQHGLNLSVRSSNLVRILKSKLEFDDQPDFFDSKNRKHCVLVVGKKDKLERRIEIEKQLHKSGVVNIFHVVTNSEIIGTVDNFINFVGEDMSIFEILKHSVSTLNKKNDYYEGISYIDLSYKDICFQNVIENIKILYFENNSRVVSGYRDQSNYIFENESGERVFYENLNRRDEKHSMINLLYGQGAAIRTFALNEKFINKDLRLNLIEDEKYRIREKYA